METIMITSEQVSIANIAHAAANQLRGLSEDVNFINRRIDFSFETVTPKEIDEISETFAKKVTEVRRILSNLKDYRFWNDRLRGMFYFQVNYPLKMLGEDVNWLSVMTADFKRRCARSIYGSEGSKDVWRTEWKATIGKDLPDLLYHYIDTLNQLAQTSVPEQAGGSIWRRKGRQEVPTSQVCSRCGVKNPKGRSECLRCHTPL